MLSPRRVARRLIRRRTAVALVALLGQLAATFGLPLPMFAAQRKDMSKPYPCMNHPCGCLSAEECWRSCCCYSNAEKVAWAAANGVELPEYVVEAAARERGGAQPKACCANEPASDCPACAAAHRRHDEPAKDEPAEPVRWLLGPAAAHCHGGPAALFESAPAPPASAPPIMKFTPASAGTLSLSDLSTIPFSAPPLDPPPRA